MSETDEDDKNTSSPGLTALLRIASQGAVDGLRVTLPAIVVSYDKTRQSITAQVAIQMGKTGEDGTRKASNLAQFTDVPVVFPAGGGHSDTWPLEEGDTVMLAFCSSSIAKWKARGGVVDPGDDRKHNQTDCVAYAGGRDFAHAHKGVADNARVMTVPTGHQLKLGGLTAAQSVPRGETLQDALSKIVIAISAGFQAITPAPVGSAANTAFTGSLTSQGYPATIASLLSQKIKVE